MLKNLTVTNFALIDHSSIEFAAGLNVLTGETGAGKSILIDALNVLLGARASTDWIREGTDFFRVEGLFELNGSNRIELERFLDDQNILLEDTLIISRRLTRHGKNTILINGCHVPLNILKRISLYLVDMHGQHENQTLLNPERYLPLLDERVPEFPEAKKNYQQIFDNWIKVRREIEKMKLESRQRAQRLDMLQWQVQEIDEAQLKTGEEEALMQKVQRLSHAEKISQALAKSYHLLTEDHKTAKSVLTALTETQKLLESIRSFDEYFGELKQQVDEAYYQVEETAHSLRAQVERVDHDPQELADCQERLDRIDQLKRKYGSSVEEILAYYEQSMKELDELTHYEEHLEEKNNELHELQRLLKIEAEKLTQWRSQAAQELGQATEKHLRDLSMPDAQLIIQVVVTEHYDREGLNDAQFLFSGNRGESPKLLYKVASGGELSRIALAIKTVCAHGEPVETLVFDEVDSGIGGQTANTVAEKIAWIASRKQVLCITHLPQITALADRHIFIEKEVKEERTHTSAKILSPKERVVELTRMITGNVMTDLALKNAKQMLLLAKEKKEKWKKEA